MSHVDLGANSQVIVKSVPPDIHQMIIASDPLTPQRKLQLKQLLKLHGTEYVHQNMTPLYVAVANGKVTKIRQSIVD